MLTRKDLQYIRWAVDGATLFSTCGKRQYMALIVDTQGHLIGTGYNGSPKGMMHCTDGGCPRLIDQSPSGSTYDNCISIHAEQNALLHSDYTARREGGALYVNGPPCFTCAKLIANSGIRKVVYVRDSSYGDFARVEEFLEQAGVDLFCVEKDDL